LRFKDAGYEFVVVSNQDRLGSAAFPRAPFDTADAAFRALFSSQGIEFRDVFYCAHTADDGCACRKPGVGFVREYLADGTLDRERSAVIGDRASDLELAENMGLPGYRVGAEGAAWDEVAHLVLDRPRTASVVRKTRETDIAVRVDLDREADAQVHTGLGFFDHMLEQLGKHGGFELSIACRGDLEVDEHHTIEDVALALGQALREALGDKRGIGRYGFVLPMDEATAEVAIDLGGRPYLVFEGEFPREQVGALPTELVPHFFRSLSDTLGASLQIRVRGDNAHHMIEACFKGVARTLRQAFARSGTVLPTTKGRL
jgi:imidazoleglycerol-phosphate dehydratase/histidinol-phosphatase